MTWLVTLGQTALPLYFIHQLIVLTLFNQRLGLRMNDWPRYLAANLALLIVLLGIGKLWMTVKARALSRAGASRIVGLHHEDRAVPAAPAGLRGAGLGA